MSPIWYGYRPRTRKDITSYGHWSNYMERKWSKFNMQRANLGADLMYVKIEGIF